MHDNASHALTPGADPRAVVLVEGISDQSALEALAERRGRDLDAEGISVVPIGGAQSIGRFLNRFGPQGLDVKLAGLCDVGEEGDFRRGLERAGLGSDLTRAEMERLGFYVCVADLEDELIRAHGAASVEKVVEAQGDLGPFRTLQKQPDGEDGPPRSSFGASWAAAADGRSDTRACSSRRSISAGCLARSTGCLPMSELSVVRRVQVRLRSPRSLRWIAPTLYVAALSAYMWREGVPVGRERLLLWIVLGLLSLSTANLGAGSAAWSSSGCRSRSCSRSTTCCAGTPTACSSRPGIGRSSRQTPFSSVAPTPRSGCRIGSGTGRRTLHWYDYAAWAVYVSYFLATYLVAGLLWFFARARFRRYVACVALLAGMAFATFALFPAAPPWLASRKASSTRRPV